MNAPDREEVKWLVRQLNAAVEDREKRTWRVITGAIHAITVLQMCLDEAEIARALAHDRGDPSL